MNVRKAESLLKIYPATKVILFLPAQWNRWKMMRY
jgi:hypothetical protein